MPTPDVVVSSNSSNITVSSDTVVFVEVRGELEEISDVIVLLKVFGVVVKV